MSNRQKGSREMYKTGLLQKNRTKKRKILNVHQQEKLALNSSASAKKFKNRESLSPPKDDNVHYRMLNFPLLFGALATLVNCKTCGGSVDFKVGSERGLGFKLILDCENCDNREIPSCSFKNQVYEINKRFVFVMRVLGLGLAGINKFCGFMDMSPFLRATIYNKYIQCVSASVEVVSKKLFEKAACEEKKEETDLTLSGYVTCQKRGFASLYGVASMIGNVTGKVMEIIVKSAHCKECENQASTIKNAGDFDEWHEKHVADNKCMSGKIVEEMFANDSRISNSKKLNKSNNERLDKLIWKIAPKIVPTAGSKIVEMAALTAACTFNEGIEALLIILDAMGVSLGPNSHD